MKRVSLLIVSLLLILSLGICVSAAGKWIIVDIGILNSSEKAQLTERATAIADEYSITICLLTVESLDGKNALSCAENFYDFNLLNMTEGNGILLLVAVEDREWAVVTNGQTHSVITDSEIDIIMEDVLDKLSYGNYYEAFDLFLTGVEEEYIAEVSAPLTQFFISLVIGSLAGGITLLVMRSGMKTAKHQYGAGNYMVESSYDLFQCRDIYLYSHTTKVRKPENNSSGGGGRSRSSGSRGGRSGRF